MGTLTGKSAIVTGGPRGIGRAVVERLARDGAAVTYSYRCDRSAAAAVEGAVHAAGGRGSVQPGRRARLPSHPSGGGTQVPLTRTGTAGTLTTSLCRYPPVSRLSGWVSNSGVAGKLTDSPRKSR